MMNEGKINQEEFTKWKYLLGMEGNLINIYI